MTKENNDKVCHVTFQVSGEQLKAMEQVTRVFGMSKTKQASLLFKLVAPTVADYEKVLSSAFVDVAKARIAEINKIIKDMGE